MCVQTSACGNVPRSGGGARSCSVSIGSAIYCAIIIVVFQASACGNVPRSGGATRSVSVSVVVFVM